MKNFIKLQNFTFRISEIQCAFKLENFDGEYCVYVKMKDGILYEIIKTTEQGEAIALYLQIEEELI